MNKLTTTALSAVTGLTLSFTSLAGELSMDPKIEKALVEVCKSVKTNKLYKYNQVMKSHRLKDRTVATKVMCNGTDIISFAERHQADKTAAKLQRSLGEVSIIDVASVDKINVTFDDN